MSDDQPSAFITRFGAPRGPYTVAFDPAKDASRLWIRFGDQSNFWMIDRCKPLPRGWEFGGLTGPAWGPWDDVYWVNVFIGGADERIEFWGKQVLARTDRPPGE
jgi:hypothetical protein